MGNRRAAARLTCERRHDRIVVVVDGAESGDAAAFDHWPALKERLAEGRIQRGRASPRRLLPLYGQPGGHPEDGHGH